MMDISISVSATILFIGCIMIVGSYTETNELIEFEDEEDETYDNHGLLKNNMPNTKHTIDDELGVVTFPLKPNLV